ncbi:MAG: hypothetical protein WC741_03600 [Patescibacteria group bacterium]|jgi:hypothetical protein
MKKILLALFFIFLILFVFKTNSFAADCTSCSYSSCGPGWKISRSGCSQDEINHRQRSCCPNDQSGGYCEKDSDCPNGYACDSLILNGWPAGGHCIKSQDSGDTIVGGSGAVSVKCNCTNAYGACGSNFGKTNIQWRQCAFAGAQTCNWHIGTTLYQYRSCDTNPTATPAPTGNPNCICNAQGSCTTQCQFNKFTDITTYSNPIKCGLAGSLFQSVPTADQKTGWCQAGMRTKGDADGNGNASLKDYFYYVAAKAGAKIPPTVNPDFNGDNLIDQKDREIIIKSIMGVTTAADE